MTDYDYPDWEPLVRDWGYDVVLFETWGSYQGDHFVLLRDGDRCGVAVIGYGSCTGCDALEAAIGYDSDSRERWRDLPEVQYLSGRERDAVRWFDSWDDAYRWVQTDEAAHDLLIFGEERDKAAARIRNAPLSDGEPT